MNPVDKLVEISSAAISRQAPNVSWLENLGLDRHLTEDLMGLLAQKNGFCAFESALVVLPSETTGGWIGLDAWNSSNGWRRWYDRLNRSVVFFAQDVFSGQYGLCDDEIVKLDPETGEIVSHARSLEGWARQMLDNHDFETGWSVAREWQHRHGPLRPGYRLLPRMPFVLGGDYVAENMVAVEGSEAMEMLGSLHVQIRDVPDGDRLTINGWMS